MYRAHVRFFTILAALLVPAMGWAAEVDIKNLRMWPAPDHTRVVFDVSAPVDHRLFTLADPHRVVVDLKNATLDSSRVDLAQSDERIHRVRSALRDDDDLRVVLDLTGPFKAKSFLLKPNSSYGHRLVIDLYQAGEDKVESASVAAASSATSELRDVIIAIDAGHGGEDPGAIGPGKTREKDVTLAVARALKTTIDKERGMRAVLVRTGDYYIGLRKRMQIAREHRADLFVSLHADAFRDPRVHGSSVYILSHNGASSEAARWLAEQENAADLVGGVSLDDKDDLLASVLLDLSQTATLNASTRAGAQVLTQLGHIGKTHKREVQRAGFMVLKSPDIPSILVETAFISNPDEERRLKSRAHQQALAESITQGVRRYFEAQPPPGTLLALRRHTITPGDTLSEIAARYQVPVNMLKTANELQTDQLRVGQVLRIPDSAGS